LVFFGTEEQALRPRNKAPSVKKLANFMGKRVKGYAFCPSIMESVKEGTHFLFWGSKPQRKGKERSVFPIFLVKGQ